ncbi:MAG: hypothetical protein K2U26_11180 [Cyclobacteriaceae bacterium]|nr:hypothetical protein [Cyclobacteriaceae bacterium]
MKTTLTLFLLLAVSLVMAQKTTELPRTEFTVNLSESNVIVKPGESKKVTVSIARSKYYAKEKATLGLLSTPPAGVTITYSPSEGNIETSEATITATADAPAGAYQLVLSASLNHKKKGAILKLVVGSDQIAAK